MTFPACLPVILNSEGDRFVVDQGGPTKLGVTQRTLSAFLGRAASVEDVRSLTPDAVSPLYESQFYNAAHCNELAAGVDLMIFDEAVNEGVGRAVRHLQQALGVIADGAFGPATLAAAQRADPAALIAGLHETNAAYYASLAAAFPKDEHGWLARNDRTRTLALGMIGS